MKAKTNEPEVTPEYFFNLWALFCQDFKVAWKRECQKLIEAKLVHLYISIYMYINFKDNFTKLLSYFK